MKAANSYILRSMIVVAGFCALPALWLQSASKPSSVSALSTNYISIEAHDAESFETNGGVRLVIFWGRVKVVDPPSKPADPQTILTCDRLTATVPATGGQIEDILAEGNVVIIQGENRATGARAIYRSTNDVVELAGSPILSTAEGTMRAPRVILDRANRRFRALGEKDNPVVMEIKTDAIGSTNKTLFPLSVPEKK